MGTFIVVNEYLENLKSLYAEFKTNQTNLKEVEIIPNVQELLENRYFVNLFNGKETKYEQLCRRVSRVIAATEISHAHLNTDIEMDDNNLLLCQIKNIENSIYTDMINGNFLFNSPCLFSAGTGFSATENGHLLYDDEITLDDYRKIYENSNNKNQMLFACFVIGIEDSIEGIFDAVKKCAIISKAGGGVGLNFSPLREKNAKIRDNEGLASGVVSFAGDFNAMGDSIRQGGKRRVALMGMLNSNHPDIEEFINCKTEEGKLTNFNISVAIDDKFMEAIQNDSDYDLISSVDGHIVKTVKARELWNNICESAHRRGDPGIFFIDLANKDNILKNDEDYCIHGVNPCGEECLPDFTSCNLGSINLANFVTTNKEFDFDEFIKMVRRGIYYLDLVIDTSAYPLPEIEERTKAIRPVGLGIMGLADMFIKLGIKYGSEESNKLSEQIAQIMAAQSLYESVKLAEIKGSFEQFDKEPQQKLLLTIYNEMVINYGIESDNNNIAIQYIKDIIDDNIKSILPISIANAFYSLYQYNKEDFYKIFHKFEDGYLRNSRRLTTAPTGCQVKDTMVVTNKGILRLDEIGNIDNSEQWSDLSNFTICQEKDNVSATKFYINGYKPTKKIKTRDGLILECTYNHKYRIFDNNGNYVWKQADELNIGDKLVYRIGGYTKQTNPNLELPYKEYRSHKKVTFPAFMNEDLAFFVGAYTGNGSLHDKGATMRIDVNMEKEEVNQRIIDVIKRLFDIDIKRIEPKKGSKGGVISIYSVEVTDKLMRLGLLKKRSITATIPRLIRESSVSCIKAFVDGLFITDGYKDRHLRKITTASWQLASELLIVLRAIGINGKIQFRNDKYHDKTYYTVVFDIYGSEDFKNGKCVHPKFRRNHDELLSIADNLYTSEIVEITDSENDTYDIEVPENNTYLANSYISHNTISMILNTSSSLEPNFAFEWKRNITNSNGTVETKIFKHKYADIENKELLVTANELTPDEHVNIVKAFAPYIDASISKCVAKGTQIQTNKGIINIEDFGNPNKEIDTFEDISDKNIYVRDMNGDWKKVLSHYRGGTKKTYIIKLKDGFTVECSENHKFMIVYNENKPNEWLSAKDIYKIYQEDIKGIVYLNDTESGKNDCCYKQIDSITESTNEVYDIEVEDTHSYLISGLVSHNTVNLSNSATVEDVKKVYENCYNNGIKGITIYRDMSREGQTLQKIDNNNKPENKQDNKQDTSSIVNNIERPKVITGFTQKGETNYGNLYATLNVVDGKPYELFVNIGKSGSLAKSLSEALSRTISISLQNGINIDEIIKTLNGIADSETPWVFEDYKGNEEWCKSIPDMIAKMMKSLSEYVKEIGTVEQNINIKNTDNTANEQNIDMSSIIEHDKCSTDKKKILCPECLKNGNEIFLVQLAGCPTCPSCGWSACA